MRMPAGLAVLFLLLLPPTVAAAPPKAAAAPPCKGPWAVEVILDASGSMNGKLPGGGTKIDAAKAAVEKVLAAVPDDVLLALRVYGSRSPREKKDCADLDLLVPFAPARESRAKAVAAAKGVTARGWTPIATALSAAAKDFPAGFSGIRAVVLVSDGKETCGGGTGKPAKAAIVVHTVGFDVDAAARSELKSLAMATGGKYADAAGADELAKALAAALVACPEKVAEKKGEGKLTVKGANLRGHDVTEAATGKNAGNVSSLGDTLTLPAGFYDVALPGGAWRGIEVKAGETTVVEPGRLTVKGASLAGNAVRDSETGEEVAKVSSMGEGTAILPGTYDVMFGEVVWPGIRVDAGKSVTLNAGRFVLKRASINGHNVRTPDGRLAGNVSAVGNLIPLPPGSYTVQLGGKAVPFTVAEGQKVEMENPPAR